MTKKIITVEDGQECWAANFESLMFYLEAQGWQIDGDRVSEPDVEDAYTALCQEVEQVEMDYDTLCDTLSDPKHPKFMWRPDWGVWELTR